MKNAYRVLGLAVGASDEEVKAAYVARVRDYPPDHHPQRFQEVRQAFEALRTEADRRRYALFASPEPDMEGIFEILLRSDGWERPSEDLFRDMLSASLSTWRL